MDECAEGRRVELEYLTDEMIIQSTRCRDLRRVGKLEMVLDTEMMVLGDLGRRLPFLSMLKCNGSNIPTIRDLGTSLVGLRVLWLNRSNVTSLAGLPALPSLEELYVAFNHITDISPVAGLGKLTTLDLEANRLSSKEDLQLLTECTELTALTLEGNPLCLEKGFKQYVKGTLTGLQYLDDVDVVEETPEDEHLPLPAREPVETDWVECERDGDKDLAYLIEVMRRDIKAKREEETAGVTERGLRYRERNLVQESIKMSSSVLYEETGSRPGTAVRPGTAGRPLSMCGARPGTAGAVRHFDAVVSEGGGSSLTRAASVFCGNPTKSLRSKKLDESAAPTHTSSTLAQSLDARGDSALLESVIADKLSYSHNPIPHTDYSDSLSLADFTPLDTL